MTNSMKALYVMYFWKYASCEQIQDMCVLSVDMIVDYILEIGKEYYLQYGIVKGNKKDIIGIIEKLHLSGKQSLNFN